MTAPAGQEPNTAAIERDLAVLLARHGLGDHATVIVDVREIEQGGRIIGVTFKAHAFTATPPAASSAAPAEDMEAVS